MGLSHRDRRRKSAEMLQMKIAPVKRANERLTGFFGSNPRAVRVKEPVIRMDRPIPAISIQNNIGIYIKSPSDAIKDKKLLFRSERIENGGLCTGISFRLRSSSFRRRSASYARTRRRDKTTGQNDGTGQHIEASFYRKIQYSFGQQKPALLSILIAMFAITLKKLYSQLSSQAG